ncbi:hypothetical protein BHF69_04055 [Anaerostipes sp. 992a]|uniref:alpha/beta fold hydrolase n=1 Tax=Anaerostipes sp. 992a TaxID=1261637 RepID=UPI000951B81C|nr:hypothetical protein [Anaerostipes sp. 992a]OLR64003.1 hypothetical protein BHF69_04055 [Anaerostipes sp. 992a]
MLWNAKNGSVRIGDTDMYYVSFGKGTDNLIMLPGLGDGLTTVKGMIAQYLAIDYPDLVEKLVLAVTLSK